MGHSRGRMSVVLVDIKEWDASCLLASGKSETSHDQTTGSLWRCCNNGLRDSKFRVIYRVLNSAGIQCVVLLSTNGPLTLNCRTISIIDYRDWYMPTSGITRTPTCNNYFVGAKHSLLIWLINLFGLKEQEKRSHVNKKFIRIGGRKIACKWLNNIIIINSYLWYITTATVNLHCSVKQHCKYYY